MGTLAQLDQCKGCTMGKYVKSTFHEKDNRASVTLMSERDSLTISCDINECTHAITHIVDVPMRNAQPRQEKFEFNCRFSISRDCAEEASCLEAVNWHMHLPIFA
jgi:hypothetical protein